MVRIAGCEHGKRIAGLREKLAAEMASWACRGETAPAWWVDAVNGMAKDDRAESSDAIDCSDDREQGSDGDGEASSFSVKWRLECAAVMMGSANWVIAAVADGNAGGKEARAWQRGQKTVTAFGFLLGTGRDITATVGLQTCKTKQT